MEAKDKAKQAAKKILRYYVDYSNNTIYMCVCCVSIMKTMNTGGTVDLTANLRRGRCILAWNW